VCALFVQVLGGGLATRGYLCRPRRGTLVTYAGNVLHGVLPGVRGDGHHTEGRRRLTLVMTWWRDTVRLFSWAKVASAGHHLGCRSLPQLNSHTNTHSLLVMQASDNRRSAAAVGQQPCVGPRMAWPDCDAAAWTSAFAHRKEGWGEARPVEEALPPCCSPVW